MKIDCIADLHGYMPVLEGGDLLIISGDLTARDEPHERHMFLQWLAQQEYRKKVWIAGNHDNSLVGMKFTPTRAGAAEYLCDSGTEFEGFKIWGSPWTKTFPGINPACKAFTVDTEEELAKKFKVIPEDTDILITHCPPFGIFDSVKREKELEYTGSVSLRNICMERKLKLHVFGHIHEHGGKMLACGLTKFVFVNASLVNERYEPVNKPVRVTI